MMRLLIVSNFYYEEMIEKMRQNQNYAPPSTEIRVIYSSNNEEIITKILRASLVEMITFELNEFKKMPMLISENEFKKKDYEGIKEQISQSLKMHYYSIVKEAFNLIGEVINIPVEQVKSKEYLAITTFLSDYYDKREEIAFNKDIENLFNTSLYNYKKMKENFLLCENYVRLATYYAYFDTHNDELLKTVQKVYENLLELPTEQRFDILLKISWVLHEKKLFRKENLNYYLCVVACLEKKEEYKFYLPILFEFLMKKFNVFDIEKMQICNKDTFDFVHHKYIRSTWKKNEYNLIEKDELKEYSKKKFEKGSKISILPYIEKIKQYILLNKWDLIQQSIYLLLINYYRDISLSSREIVLALSYLQTLYPFISQAEEQNILNSFISNSLNQQNKLYVSLLKFPILIRVIPIASPIKFDVIQNENSTSNQLFLYNPWDKKITYNFYWTENSFQKINVQFRNPLKIEITISKISILFQTNENTKTPISYPSTLSIPPETTVSFDVKIKPISQGVINIIGVKYEIANAIAEQYVDSNGNGLFYSFDNKVKELSAIKAALSKKKNLISINNIQIYPEIPFIQLKILGDSINSIDNSISLYEYQYYNFSFMVENKGNYPINEIKCKVYAYKKEDYKVNIKEIVAKTEDINNPLIPPGKSYQINYLYFHQKSDQKIEFRLYYMSEQQSQQIQTKYSLKPYILYSKSLNTEKLITFNNLKIIPKIISSCVGELVKMDTRLSRRYEYKYCTNKHIFSLTAKNEKENKMKIQIEDKNGNKLLEEVIDNQFSKELSFEVSLDVDVMSLIFDWEFTTTNNTRGQINFSEILSNSTLDIKRKCEIDFKLETTEYEDYIDIVYTAVNCTGREIKKPKMYIYFYRYHEKGGFSYNNRIQDDSLFYTGTLALNPGIHLQHGEKMENEVKLYHRNSSDMMRTSFVLVDKENQKVYLSPIDIKVLC